MAASPNRRALLLASLATPALAIPMVANADDRRDAWIAALDGCRAAEDAAEASWDAYTALEEAVVEPALPDELIYRYRVLPSPELRIEELRSQFAVDARWPPGAFWCEKHRTVVQAAYDRWSSACADAHHRLDVPVAESKAGEALQASGAAYRRLITTPAPDMAALQEKLARIIDREDFEDGVHALAADIDRLGNR